MLKEIDFKEVKKMWEDGEIGRVLYVYPLYPDGTEAYIDNNARWTDIVKHHDNGGKFAVEVTGKKFKVEIVETYRRYVEVEAEDEDVAYQDIDDKINNGEIDLPCDGENYKYDRELFVSEVKGENDSLENDNKDDFCEWSSGNGSVNYDTDCGHTYFPYVKGFNQPKRIEDGEYDRCPWCGKRIEYNEGNDW